MSEKVGGAEGTKLDDDFKEMERVSLNTAYIHYYHALFLSKMGISKILSWNHSENFEILNFYSAGLRGLNFPFSFCFLTKGYLMYSIL